MQTDLTPRRLEAVLPRVTWPAAWRTSSPSARGARTTVTRDFPGTVLTALEKLSCLHGTTLSVTLLAAFQTLLHRYTGQRDIVVGWFSDGRMFPVRNEICATLTFSEVVTRVRDGVAGTPAGAGGDVERQTHEPSPLWFGLRTGPESESTLASAQAQPLIRPEDEGVDGRLWVEAVGGRFRASLDYDTGRFERAAMARVLGHFEILLTAVTALPAPPLSQLPILTESERHRLLIDWNLTQAEYPADRCCHELFEAQAGRTPHAVAAVVEETSLTYAELNARANRLARRLRRIGVSADSRVGLCVERSVDMLVGMLGILKAGGAYVPLDPEYPIDHLAFVLDDAHVSVIVIQQRFADRMPPTDSQPRRIIVIDVAAEDLGGTNLPSLSGPEDLAYVMYTSGSTGKPKGVMVTHRNLVHSTTARLTFYRDAVESFLLLPSFSFDASVAAIFWTLCTGGRLLLPVPGAERDPSAICRLIARRRASHVLCVCSLYHHIVERATTADLASIKVAVIGGEMCPPKLIASHREKAPHALLFNEYGLTEGTVWSTACEVSRRSNDEIGSIGRPIPNTKIYILDSELAPVPIGVPGELYIGGDGVARGYLNRVDLTSARFVPDPFASRPGGRLYKTGDVAQYHEDGNIELLGRIDHQVKIRGRRVETGEIEAVLALHQSVRRAFVTVLEESRDRARLVAYVVAQTDQGLTARDLRRFLSRKLPDFMVPAEFVVLDSLPMTPTGKVDRHALSAQRAARPRIAGDVNAVRPLEAQFRHLWEELLEVGPIAVSDNFFELGGHSLLAVELITRVEMLTGTELSLTSLLEAPTVRQFADHVARASRKTALTLVPLRPDGFRPPFFCVHALNGTALTYESLARHLGPDQPVYALQAVGLDGTHRPDCRVEEMAVRYLHEIRTRQANGPYYLGGHSFGGLVAFEIARRLEAEGEVVELLALFDTFSPLGPPPTFGTEPRKSMVSRMREWMQLHLWGELRLRKRSVEPSGFFHVRARVATLARSLLLVLWGRVREFCHAGVPRLLRALEDVSAANRLAHFQYVPKAYSGRVAMFRASARSDGEPDVLAGWRAVVKRIELYEAPGDHVNMMKEPHVRELAEQLRRVLDSKDGIRDAIGVPLRREPNSRAPEQWDRLDLVHL